MTCLRSSLVFLRLQMYKSFVKATRKWGFFVGFVSFRANLRGKNCTGGVGSADAEIGHFVLARSLEIGLSHTWGRGVTQTYGRGVSHTCFGALGVGQFVGFRGWDWVCGVRLLGRVLVRPMQLQVWSVFCFCFCVSVKVVFAFLCLSAIVPPTAHFNVSSI